MHDPFYQCVHESCCPPAVLTPSFTDRIERRQRRRRLLCARVAPFDATACRDVCLGGPWRRGQFGQATRRPPHRRAADDPAAVHWGRPVGVRPAGGWSRPAEDTGCVGQRPPTQCFASEFMYVLGINVCSLPGPYRGPLTGRGRPRPGSRLRPLQRPSGGLPGDTWLSGHRPAVCAVAPGRRAPPAMWSGGSPPCLRALRVADTDHLPRRLDGVRAGPTIGPGRGYQDGVAGRATCSSSRGDLDQAPMDLRAASADGPRATLTRVQSDGSNGSSHRGAIRAIRRTASKASARRSAG
jgi:hypothetical protein